MTPAVIGWLIAGLLAGAFAAVLILRLIAGRREPGFLAHAEYWVYVAEPQVPKTEDLMTRMVSDNPHNRPGRACITNREGMLFTDIRLHVAAALRSKNPHAFRPDLFDDVELSAEVLSRLADSQGVVKARYLSRAPLKDTRHLQFLPHMADAISDLCGGLAVLDTVSDEVFLAEDFKQKLSQNGNAERPDLHVRVVWRKTEEGWRAMTRGLSKVGLSEWQTDPLEADQEVLATGLLLRAAFQVLRRPEDALGPFEYEEYGDSFILTPALKTTGGLRTVEILRRTAR